MTDSPVAKYFVVEVYSHHFCIKKVREDKLHIIMAFAKNYNQMGLVKKGRFFVRAPVKVFASRSKPNGEYRFHYGQWPEFLHHLIAYGVKREMYDMIEYNLPEPRPFNFQLLPKWKPLEKQVPVIEYLTNPQPSKKKLVQLQPGFGKTFCAVAGATEINVSIAVFLKPQFIEKWEGDFPGMLGCKEEDIYIVKGSDSLIKLLHMGKNGDEIPRIIIISNKTFQNWIKAYEEDGDDTLDQGYACRPHEFYTLLGIGLRLVDEVHMDFHLNFKIDLYTHVEWSHSLSATLISDDPFIARMQFIAYPEEMRLLAVEFVKYVHSYAVLYRLGNPDPIRYLGGPDGKNYSHIEYEKNFFRNKKLMKDFLQMLEGLVVDHYINRKVPGDTCLVYAASIQMATVIAEYLGSRFKDVEVQRYVEDDNYDNLMNSDIAVSTLQSAGTGHDKAGLITVILTVSVSSSAANIQGFGRLRDLKDKETRFLYLTCTDIDKQVSYWEKKEELLATMAKSIHEIRIPTALG